MVQLEYVVTMNNDLPWSLAPSVAAQPFDFASFSTFSYPCTAIHSASLGQRALVLSQVQFIVGCRPSPLWPPIRLHGPSQHTSSRTSLECFEYVGNMAGVTSLGSLIAFVVINGVTNGGFFTSPHIDGC
jgi:hypothetical protein